MVLTSCYYVIMGMYSVCLILSGEVYKEFAEIIETFSKKYLAPKFEPHLTLIGGWRGNKKEAISKTKKLASLLFPFSTATKGIGYTEKIHKALFINCDNNEKLANARLIARRIFNRKEEEYLPHISLIYGKFSEKEKRRMIKSLKKYPKLLKFNSICLFDVENNDEEKWFKVSEFKIK